MEIRKLIREVLRETAGQSVELRAETIRERIAGEDIETALMAGLRELVRQEMSAVRSAANRSSSPRTGSWKTRGIQQIGEEWKRMLEVEYTVEHGRKPLAQCTRDDLLFNVASREKAAAATLTQAARLRELHDLLIEHDVHTVGDLPESVQRDYFTNASAA